MKSFSVLPVALGLFVGGAALSTSVGCAKKKAPEVAEPGSAFTVELGQVQLLRRDTTTIREKNQLRYTLRLNNGMTGGPVSVSQVDYSFGIGDRQMGAEVMPLTTTVASGGMEKVTLIGDFDWVETSDMPPGDAWVKGTVSWTGPNTTRSTTFEFSKGYTLGE